MEIIGTAVSAPHKRFFTLSDIVSLFQIVFYSEVITHFRFRLPSSKGKDGHLEKKCIIHILYE